MNENDNLFKEKGQKKMRKKAPLLMEEGSIRLEDMGVYHNTDPPDKTHLNKELQ